MCQITGSEGENSMKFFIFLNFVLISLTVLCTSQARAAVWIDKQTWNAHWEEKFSSWVKNEFDEDFFTHGKYKGISTDCADAVYFSRLVFAAENDLPFVIKDPTGGSQRITNKMSRFDSVKDPHQRLRKFMNFIAVITSTRSLHQDTYPVKVNRANIRPGTTWSRPRIKRENILNLVLGTEVKEDPGHAEVVRDVNESGIVEVIGSTVPPAVRKLQVTTNLVFLPIETTTGFRRWYLPEEYSMNKENIPNYSLEQFNIGGQTWEDSRQGNGKQKGERTVDSWSNEIYRRLKESESTKESQDAKLKRIVVDLCNLANTRAEIIKKSESFRLKLKGSCMDANAYDNYSTPSRDKRIYSTLKEAVKVGGGFGFTTSQSMNALEPVLRTCDIEIKQDVKLSLWSFLKSLANGDTSSDPNESLQARWGLAPHEDRDCPEF